MKRVGNILFVVLLALPLLQKATRVFPELPLHGVETGKAKTPLTPATWFGGAYTRDYETRLSARIGFRGILVKLDNQLRYSIFGRVPGKRGTQIVVGKNRWLYENGYIDYAKKNPQAPPEHLRHYAGRLRRLQDLLARRGIAFLFLISPSKVEIYPENLPDDIRRMVESRNRPTIRERLLPCLDEAGVRYVDAHGLFKRIRDRSEILFAPGGTHWNYYACVLVCREIARRINETTPLTLPLPRIEAVAHGPPEGTDNDLELLMNMLSFRAHKKSPIPYPAVRVEAPPAEERPPFLFVGDSFAFTLLDAARYAKLCGAADLLYYNSRLYAYPAADVAAYATDPHDAEVGPVADLPPGWDRRLLQARVVILESNEILLNKRAWGFVEETIRRLEPAGADPLPDRIAPPTAPPLCGAPAANDPSPDRSTRS